MGNRLRALLRLSLVLSLPLLAWGTACAGEVPALRVFYSPGCSHCIKFRREVVPTLERQFANRIVFEYFDIDKVSCYKFLLALRQKYQPALNNTLPVLEMNGRFFEPYGKPYQQVAIFIEGARKVIPPEGHDLLPEIDLAERLKGMTLAVVLGAGLVDGVNPCAFTVIVFFMTFMAMQGYRRRELVLVGLSFVTAVMCMYLLLGVGLFNFLFALRGYWALVQGFNIAVGVFSMGLGCAAVYDLVLYRKRGSSEGLLLQLPGPVKNMIHKVIGDRHRAPRDKDAAGERKGLFSLAAGAFVTGCIVSVLEAVCTGQAYLPTIAFVLKQSPQKLKAFLYLVLYNIMFIVPLLGVFFAVIFGVGSSQFSKFMREHMVLIKAAMAALFFGFGAYLLFVR